jgi:hypothetical protein
VAKKDTKPIKKVSSVAKPPAVKSLAKKPAKTAPNAAVKAPAPAAVKPAAAKDDKLASIMSHVISKYKKEGGA